MTSFKNVVEALKYIDKSIGKSETFELAISDQLRDPVGINMALITDRIIARGWEPDGFKREDGYRLYLYKEME